MLENANSPLAEKLSQVRMQDDAPDSTRNALLSDKRAQQRDYLDQDAAGKSVEALGRWWSQFADSSLDQALSASWRETKQAARFVSADLGEAEPVPGLFVLGLGKLGGRDLNFSSDVDLVAFYEAETVPVPEFIGRTDITARVLRGLTQTVDGHKTGQFVWRTDWRLRPDPSVTDLSMSTEAAEDYHFYRAAPWRRLAMIKARVVAGDKAAGERFLANMHPYLWRRHLDFSMIEEIAHLKGRIRREHPDLAEERRNVTPLAQAAGFHLKLGRGGIRDIEFFVNAQQLLWAGRHPALQTTSTMEALRCLADEGIVDAAKAKDLEQAYWFLRGLENRVQYWADGHTHFVPHKPVEQAWLAELSGLPSWESLEKSVADTRAFVEDAVAPLFADQDSSAESVTVQEPEEDPDGILAEKLRTWKQEAHGGDAPDLIWQAAQASADFDGNIKSADSLLRRLGNRGQYLRLMSTDHRLFEAVIPPLFGSPAMASLLDQSAHVVDGLLGRSEILPTGPELEQGRAMIAASASYEGKLEAARAWVNEQLYLVYLSAFTKRTTAAQAEHHLTLLSEAALTLVAELVMHEMGLNHFPLCILGMGKLGMNAMAPHSDLDLIFVVEDGWSLEEANAVAARFNTAFNAQMREGRVWEIDTRLRPSGRSGPPTITFSSFETHHLERAKTWEHLAQVPMRPISGSADLRQKIERVKRQILTRPRDSNQLQADAYRMLLRLRDQRIYDRPDDPGEVKLRPGGLMELEYLLAVQTLRFGADLPADIVFEHDDLAALWERREPALQGLSHALRSLRDWFFASRLFGPKWMDHVGDQTEAVSVVTNRVSEAVYHLIDQPAEKIGENWVEYQEQSVSWQA